MGSFSIWHLLIVLAVVPVLFGGKGKISALLGDLGHGITAFKKGLKTDKEGETKSAEASDDNKGIIDRS